MQKNKNIYDIAMLFTKTTLPRQKNLPWSTLPENTILSTLWIMNLWKFYTTVAKIIDILVADIIIISVSHISTIL